MEASSEWRDDRVGGGNGGKLRQNAQGLPDAQAIPVFLAILHLTALLAGFLGGFLGGFLRILLRILLGIRLGPLGVIQGVTQGVLDGVASEETKNEVLEGILG